MTATIEAGVLVVRIPLSAPRPSASGKTLVVATSGGNKPTAAVVDGKPVVIGISAYVNK